MSSTNDNIETSKAQQDENKEFKVDNSDKRTAVILIADGSEEIETVVAYDVLYRAGFKVLTVGVGLDRKDGAPARIADLSRGLQVIPTHTFLDVGASIVPDVLVLPGGAAGAKVFCEQGTIQNYIRQVYRKNFESDGRKHYIAAICAATTAVVKALDEATEAKDEKTKDSWRVKVTSHSSVADYIKEKGWEYSEDRVVVDGQVITSRGPGTAMEWALKIVEVVAEGTVGADASVPERKLASIKARRRAQEGMFLPENLVF